MSDINNTESFAQLFEESLAKQEMRQGEVITAEVVRVDYNFVVVNAGLKSEAYVPIEEFKDDRGEVTVQPGDTLAGLAEQHGLDGWRPIFDLNAGEVLPGGGRFTDPDLIRPGQVLDLPPADPPARAPIPPSGPEPPLPAPPHEDEPTAPAGSPPPTASRRCR